MPSFFNLPFAVRIAGNVPVDGDRYIATDIATRDALIGSGREFDGLKVFVESDKTLYLLTDAATPIWDAVLTSGSTSGNTLSPFSGNSITGSIIPLSGSNLVSGLFSTVIGGSGNTVSGDYATAEGLNTLASGDYSTAEGANTTASGGGSHAEGFTTFSDGAGSHTEGASTTALGNFSHAEGQNTTAVLSESHAEGLNTTARGAGSHAEGDNTVASGTSSHAEGHFTTAIGGLSHAEGSGTTASGVASHVEGRDSVASGNYSHAEGWDTVASGSSSHAEGRLTTSSGNYSHAEGRDTVASGAVSHAEGDDTTASGFRSHAEGNNTIASGISSHAEGAATTAFGTASHAEGSNTLASGLNSHAAGETTTASGQQSHAGGTNSVASGLTSFVHSSGSTSDADQSAILGGGTNILTSTAERSVILGGAGITGTEADTVYGINFNASNNISGNTFYSGSTDIETIIRNISDENTDDITRVSGGTNISTGGTVNLPTIDLDADIVLTSVNATTLSGDTIYSGSTDLSTIIINAVSTVEETPFSGNSINGAIIPLSGDNTSSGNFSFTVGSGNTASGNYATAEGQNTLASGNFSHAEGEKTTAGFRSHAEGLSTTALGNVSHAEGSSTTASGLYSHAEGVNTKATGNFSHAEGNATTASSNFSHAEGFGTIASATGSHAEGSSTTASGSYTHAGGKSSTASGSTSFVHSSGSTSDADNSAILGGGTNTLTAAAERSIILGGAGITGTEADTVYGINFNASNNISGNTFYSGSTDIETIIRNISDENTDDITRVQGGTNVSTGGTANAPIINLDADIFLNSVNSVSISGGTLSGDTIFSGTTDLSDLFLHNSAISGIDGRIAMFNGTGLEESILSENNSGITVNGNLTVLGTATTINSVDTYVVDNVITINSGETGGGVTAGIAGLEVDRGTEPNTSFLWKEDTESWKVGNPEGTGATYNSILTTASVVSGPLASPDSTISLEQGAGLDEDIMYLSVGKDNTTIGLNGSNVLSVLGVTGLTASDYINIVDLGNGNESPTLAAGISASTMSAETFVSTGGIVANVRNIVASDTAALTDHIITVNGAGVTVTLPAAPPTGTEFIIKDISGSASSNNITVDPTGAVTIDSVLTDTLNNDYESARYVFNGSEYMNI